MEAKAIVATAAAALSIALEVVPGLRDLWQRLPGEWRALTVLILCLGIPVAATGAACLGVDLRLGATCPDPTDPQLWADAVLTGLSAYLGSQISFEALGRRARARQTGVG